MEYRRTGSEISVFGNIQDSDLLESGRCRIACLVETGAVFAIPFSRREVLLSNEAGDTNTEYVRGWGGRSVFWQCRGTILFSFSDWGIGLSYSLNDIDMYSSVRNLSYNGTDFYGISILRKEPFTTLSG